MRPPYRYLGFGLSTLSGCLWFIACTPYDLAALAWIAAVPMLFAIDRSTSFKGALFLGWWAGVVETAGGFYWISDVMQRFAGFASIAAFLVFCVFCATRAVIFLMFAAIVRAIGSRRRFGMALLAPITMAVCEFIVPQLFPSGQWITQAWQPLVIQITELTGPLGVTALLMLVNGAIYDCLDRRPRAAYSAAATALIVAAALLFGAVRMHQIDVRSAHAPRLKVGLVQPNFAYSADGDFSREEALRELAVLQDESRRLQEAGAQLVVWSEGSYPVALPRDFAEDFPADSPAMIRRGFDVPVILGANTVGAGPDEVFNTALLLDAGGRAAGRYDKVQLMAFGEYMPGIDIFPWLKNLTPAGSDRFRAGSGPRVMSLRAPDATPWRLGPLICYEDLLPGVIRGVGKLRPDLLVNLTSDSWFGAHSEPWQHLALSVFSTIELRVPLVRSVNSGVSASIDANGRLLSRTYANDPYRDPRAADGLLVTVPKMAGGNTVFVAWGDWFAYACALLLLALGLHGRVAPTRNRG